MHHLVQDAPAAGCFLLQPVKPGAGAAGLPDEPEGESEGLFAAAASYASLRLRRRRDTTPGLDPFQIQLGAVNAFATYVVRLSSFSSSCTDVIAQRWVPLASLQGGGRGMRPLSRELNTLSAPTRSASTFGGLILFHDRPAASLTHGRFRNCRGDEIMRRRCWCREVHDS
jgi:hypothetical protein